MTVFRHVALALAALIMTSPFWASALIAAIGAAPSLAEPLHPLPWPDIATLRAWPPNGADLSPLPQTLLLNTTIFWRTLISLLANMTQASINRLYVVGLAAALAIAVCRTLLATLAVFALTCFRFPFRPIIAVTLTLPLILPIETRLAPSRAWFLQIGLVDLGGGTIALIAPLIESAATLLILRRLFIERTSETFLAAQLDGAGPLCIWREILLPTSQGAIGVLFAVHFVCAWNQYLWPILLAPSQTTAVAALPALTAAAHHAGALSVTSGSWPLIFMAALLSLIPPVLMWLCVQRPALRLLTRLLTPPWARLAGENCNDRS
ncbi:sn-glycerol-3-phosphate transport system permease protein UgpE [Azospirillaceae bacterium]